MLSVTTRNVRLAQLDRAFGYGPKGREFESSNARNYRCRRYAYSDFFALYMFLPAVLSRGDAVFFLKNSAEIL